MATSCSWSWEVLSEKTSKYLKSLDHIRLFKTSPGCLSNNCPTITTDCIVLRCPFHLQQQLRHAETQLIYAKIWNTDFKTNATAWSKSTFLSDAASLQLASLQKYVLLGASLRASYKAKPNSLQPRTVRTTDRQYSTLSNSWRCPRRVFLYCRPFRGRACF